MRRFAIDWNHEHRGRAWDGTAEILQKYRVGPTGAREKVPGQGTGRGGDGHDRFQLHLRSGPEVRRAGEHHPQLDGRGGRKAGQGVCRGQSPGSAGDRSPGGAGSRAQVGYLQQRVAENRRASEICTKLRAKLDEDARARKYTVGALLKSQEEELADATETGMVVYSQPGSYDRELDYEQRKELEAQLERYDAQVMSDRDAANVAAVLMNAAANAAALVPWDEGSTQSAAPAVLMEAKDDAEQQEVVLDGTAGD